MKLSKKEAREITKKYDLGNLKSIKTISNGWSNFNFELNTTRGKFILQVFGRKINNWKRDKIKLEFSLLQYLNQVNFPYKIPYPIKNKKLKYMDKIRNKEYWIYSKINGNIHKKINESQFRECAKALAILHKFLKNFKFETKYEDFNNFDWILERYERMKKIEPRDKTDLLMLKNLPFFEKVMNKLKKINYGKNKTFCHSDFNNENLLFKHNKITGIIDFDDVQISPIAHDIAIALVKCKFLGRLYNEGKKRIFLEEYRKIMPFSKSEERLIIPLLLKNNCVTFWWFYEGMEKNLDKRYSSIKKLIKEAKENYSKI